MNTAKIKYYFTLHLTQGNSTFWYAVSVGVHTQRHLARQESYSHDMYTGYSCTAVVLHYQLLMRNSLVKSCTQRSLRVENCKQLTQINPVKSTFLDVLRWGLHVV